MPTTLDPSANETMDRAVLIEPRVQKAQAEHDQRTPALDGIRGVAILLVLVLHFLSLALPRDAGPIIGVFKTWGWVGVDLFFALSGFLITGILIDAKGSPNYFRSFYARRVLRILPAYYLTLVLMLVVLPLSAPGVNALLQPPVYGPGWPYWTHTSNLYFAATGYADGPLGHTWSLAIEEQFYLLWPAIVFVLSGRGLFRLCVGIVVLMPFFRAVLLASGAPALSVYFFTPSRLDGLVMGAIVAQLVRQSPSTVPLYRAATIVAVVAPLLLAASIVTKKIFGAPGTFLLESTKYVWIALGCSALVMLTVTGPANSLLKRVLGSSPLTFFGRYSYGMYLFHLPIASLLADRPNSLHPTWGIWLNLALYSAGTIGLSLISWNLYEKRLLRFKSRFPMWPGSRDVAPRVSVATAARTT
jgi:peptidoglycan/LPS O-acetylase OafA/YrhL